MTDTKYFIPDNIVNEVMSWCNTEFGSPEYGKRWDTYAHSISRRVGPSSYGWVFRFYNDDDEIFFKLRWNDAVL